MGELDRDFAPSSAIFSYSVGGRYSQSPYIKFTYYDAKHCRSDRDELRITTLNSEDKFVIFKGETPAEINERILKTVADGKRLGFMLDSEVAETVDKIRSTASDRTYCDLRNEIMKICYLQYDPLKNAVGVLARLGFKCAFPEGEPVDMGAFGPFKVMASDDRTYVIQKDRMVLTGLFYATVA